MMYPTYGRNGINIEDEYAMKKNKAKLVMCIRIGVSNSNSSVIV